MLLSAANPRPDFGNGRVGLADHYSARLDQAVELDEVMWVSGDQDQAVGVRSRCDLQVELTSA